MHSDDPPQDPEKPDCTEQLRMRTFSATVLFILVMMAIAGMALALHAYRDPAKPVHVSSPKQTVQRHSPAAPCREETPYIERKC
ncbi:MAG: hypothetical protein ACRECY_18915 [Phyllobacterium sp.]